MYRYVKALVRDGRSANRWREEALVNTPIATIFNLYREVLLVVTHDALSQQVTVNLKDVAAQFSGVDSALTVSQWLAGLDGESLPTVDGVPSVKSYTAKYRDAFEAGYKANLIYAEGSPLTDVPDSEKDDILLSKDGLDYSSFYVNCLVTVNGMVHRTDYDERGIHVKRGGESFRLANENHLGIISFKDIGKLTTVSITDEMIYNPHPNGKLHSAAYIKLPEDIGNRMVALVIGGYLHLVDSYYHCINDRVVKIDTAKLPLLPRFYESGKLINLDAMREHHDRNVSNPDHVALEDLFSDDSIRAYLTLSQSFVVLIETDNLYVEKHKLGYSHLPGRYHTHLAPQWPARTELGRLPEYIAIDEQDLWSIAIQDNFSTRYLFETTDYENMHSVDSARISNGPVFYAQGHFLEIGTDKLVYTQVAA